MFKDLIFIKKDTVKPRKFAYFSLTVILSFFFVIPSTFMWPVYSMEEREDLQYKDDLFRIGFEIEFPYYGVCPYQEINKGKDHTEKVLLLAADVEKVPLLEDDKKIWVLYRDTLDSQVEKEVFEGKSAGIWNLEFKTLQNGVSLQRPQEMLGAIDEISKVLENFSSGKYSNKNFGLKGYPCKEFPENVAGVGAKYKYSPIEESEEGEKKLFLVQKKENYNQVRPQLTHQLPLSCLPYLFRHLYILGGKMDIKNFFAKPQNMERIKNLHQEVPKPVQGLILLFDYYVDRFICTKHSTTEPGPKPSFSMISRLSFRDMYKHLPEEEKEEFKHYVSEKYYSFECKGYEYLALKDNIRPLVQAFEQAEKDIATYTKEKEALSKKAECSEINEALEFYNQRENQTRDLVESYSLKKMEYENNLNALLHKGFGDKIIIRYVNNMSETVKDLITGEESTQLGMVDFSLSMEDLLDSIIEENFEEKISIESPDAEALVEKNKKSDWFSTPFVGLDEAYSMGALPYPEVRENQAPLAVVEVRSYPSILGEIEHSSMHSLIEAEIKYLKAVQDLYAQKVGLEKNEEGEGEANKSLPSFRKCEEENVRLLSQVSSFISSKASQGKSITSLDKIDSFYSS